MTDIDVSHDTETAKYAGVGFMGGMFSCMPSLKTLRWYEWVCCGFSGMFVAALGTPAFRDTVWKEAPESMLFLLAGFLGLGSPVILGIITAWWKSVAKKKPLDRLLNPKLGLSVDSDPTPLPPTNLGK